MPEKVQSSSEKLPFNPKEYTLAEILKPNRSALIVVDVQNDFCDPNGFFAQKNNADVSQMTAIVSHVQHLIDVAHLANVPVIYTQGSEDVRFRTGPGFRRAIKWEERDGDGSVCTERGTWGWEFYQVQPQAEDIVLEKHKWSAFDGKDKEGKSLDEILKEKGVQTLVITGVVTETCVHSTAQGAHDRDYFVVMPKNCVGSDKPNQHEAVLEHTEGFLGDVVEEEVIKEHWPPATLEKRPS